MKKIVKKYILSTSLTFSLFAFSLFFSHLGVDNLGQSNYSDNERKDNFRVFRSAKSQLAVQEVSFKINSSGGADSGLSTSLPQILVRYPYP